MKTKSKADIAGVSAFVLVLIFAMCIPDHLTIGWFVFATVTLGGAFILGSIANRLDDEAKTEK